MIHDANRDRFRDSSSGSVDEPMYVCVISVRHDFPLPHD
jgi:hypothetical protein